MILRKPEVSRMVGLSSVTIMRMVAIGKFPSPVKLNKRAIGWKKKDLDDWIDSRETTTNNNGENEVI